MSSASAKLGAVASPKKTIIEEGVGTPSILPCTTEHGKTSFERLKIRFNQAVPMVDQIVEHVATALAMGALRPEERLPPIEAAAKYTHVGTSTMRDAYLVLAKHGLSCNTATGSYLPQPQNAQPVDTCSLDMRMGSLKRHARSILRMKKLSVSSSLLSPQKTRSGNSRINVDV